MIDIKNILVNFYNEKGYPFIRQLKFRLKYHFRVMNFKETIEYILKNKCSISRFGDGEFGIILHSNHPDFQEKNEQLAKRLIEVCTSKESNLLVCIPHNFISTKDCNENAKKFWEWWMWNDSNLIKIAQILKLNPLKRRVFGDAQITRPYMDWKNKSDSAKKFDLLKLLWNDKDILIVEGENTKLGVNNDLFMNAKSIIRIIAPAINAFNVYDELLIAIIQNARGKLVLLALGPTATVLSYDLSKKNIQALDVGHVDIEYEWFLHGAIKKEIVIGKDVQEVHRTQKKIIEENSQYLSEIIKYIGV